MGQLQPWFTFLPLAQTGQQTQTLPTTPDFVRVWCPLDLSISRMSLRLHTQKSRLTPCRADRVNVNPSVVPKPAQSIKDCMCVCIRVISLSKQLKG